MGKRFVFLVLTIPLCVSLAVVGYASRIHHTEIDAGSIPEKTYDVTVYQGDKPLSYAVLFDIPDDGMTVVMQHTALTSESGEGSPAKYIDHFRTEIKGYRAMTITDREGTVRAYLIASNFIHFAFYEAHHGKSMGVRVEDPYASKED